MILNEYKNSIINLLNKIETEEENNINLASDIVFETIKNNGLIYIFGCGHSGMLSMEGFYRAGGLGIVEPIFISPLMLHESATESSRLEKLSGYYNEFKNSYNITKNDCLITISTSNKNATPVEFTNYIKNLGVKTISIYSSEYNKITPHNEINKHLSEITDVAIDNKVPYGDACLNILNKQEMTPISTILGAYILNSILAISVEKALKNNIQVPVFMSGNIEGGTEYNKKITDELKKRIKHL